MIKRKQPNNDSNYLQLQCETLEARQMLSSVQIFAAGVTNEEVIELKVDDAVVQTWENVGGDAYAGQFVELNFNTAETIAPEQLKIEFINDYFDAATGTDSNVRIDKIVVDGVTIETESAGVFSTGTWLPEDGIVPGFRGSEFLHTNGYFQYPADDTGGGDPTGSTIDIRVSGHEGTEQFNLLIKGINVGSYDVGTAAQTISYTHTENFVADDVRIEFTNDEWDPVNGIDSNLSVDFIVVDGATYQTEDPAVFSTGTWLPGGGITSGFRQSETLHVNGYFQYAGNNGGNQLPGEISVGANLTVAEDVGSLTLTLTRTGGSDGAVSVDYATVANSADPSDYVAQNGTVNFADGQTSATIVISILTDGLNESNENFFVQLSNAAGGVTIGDGSQRITITDVVTQSPGVISLGPNVTVDEGSGSVALTLTRSGGSDGAVSVDFETASGTAGINDFVAQLGTVNFADGQTTATISIDIQDDAVLEDTENFTVLLSNATGGATIGDADQLVIITDNEIAFPGIISTSGDVSVSEDAGSVTLTLTRDGGANGPVSVDFATVDYTASESDFVHQTGTVNFADGQLTATITIDIQNDGEIESNEEFFLLLTNPTGGATIGTATQTITITDDEVALPGVISIGSDGGVYENDGTATMRLFRTGGTDGAVSVNYTTVAGTAGSGDFVAKSGTVNFADGQTEATISISIINNSSFEGTETFRVELSNATGGAVIGDASQTTYIIDNDGTDGDHISITDIGRQFLQDEIDNGDIRNVSGEGNNLNNPFFGTANQPFIRSTFADLGANNDPRGVVNGVQTLPNEREISNRISDQDDNNDGTEDKTFSEHGTNLFLMTFGQFFDHGLDFLQRSDNPNDVYYIPLDPSDQLYSYSDDGNPFNDITSIRVTRGEQATDPQTGQPLSYYAHINKTSPFIDQNQTYGSSDAVAFYLRESARDADGNLILDGNGQLEKTFRLLDGAVDESGRGTIPLYRDILLNNGMSQADIDAAVAANSWTMLMQADGFVDFRNVKDPVSGSPDGNPLLLDINFRADPEGNFFDLGLLLDHYVAGDGRVNENVGLTSIHTVFHRDHNHWAEKFAATDNYASTDQDYFEQAKAVVESEYQRIIFDEFVDAMAGSLPGPTPHGFDGYHPRVDAQISEEFAHSVYRVGHSMITEKLPFIDSNGNLTQESLVNLFLNPRKFAEQGTSGQIAGQAAISHEKIDVNLVNAVRNQLLGRASDLAAINIARGREVGVPSLNDVRRFLYENGSAEEVNGSDVTRALKGNPELRPYDSWDDFESNLRDKSLINDFKALYDSVDDVDLWIGGLAEKNRSEYEGQMGTTFTWIFWNEMDKLQDGDRFYYKGRFADTEVLSALETQNFSDIIMRNTDLNFLNDNIFFLTNQEVMDANQVQFNSSAQKAGATLTINSQNGGYNGNVLVEITDINGSKRIETVTTNYDGNVGNSFDLSLKEGETFRVAITDPWGTANWSNVNSDATVISQTGSNATIGFEDENGNDYRDVVISVAVKGSATLLTTSGNVYGGASSGEIAVNPVAGAAQTLAIWELNSLDVNVAWGRSNPFPNSNTGTSNVNGNTMTILSNATPKAVGITETDNDFEDVGSQDLVSHTTINGVFGSAGTEINTEFAYSVTNSAGQLINIYVVQLNDSATVGFVADAPLVKGETYTFVQRTSTAPRVSYDNLATSYIDPSQISNPSPSFNSSPNNDPRNETIVGNALDNIIFAGEGNDTVYGQQGNDQIYGGDGDDGLRGDEGDDWIDGGDGENRIAGGEGNDTIFGGSSQDALNGNQGDDEIHGGSGEDEIHGNSGNDTLYGGSGKDVIKGGLGNDTIDAGDGDDKIESNGGNDTITTGSGRDVIKMSDDAGTVVVTDFDHSQDRVDLSIFNVRNFADVQAKINITSSGGSVRLQVGSSVIILQGVSLSQFDLVDNVKFRNDNQNLVINGRMDEQRIVVDTSGSSNEIRLADDLGTGDWDLIDENKVVAWRNSGSSIVQFARYGKANNSIDIDVNGEVDEIYQDLPTKSGQVYSVSFDAMRHPNAAGNSTTHTVILKWNGTEIGRVDPSAGWDTYEFAVTGTGGMDRLSFAEDAGDNNYYGASVDNVIVKPSDGTIVNPPTPTSAIENGNIVQLRNVGNSNAYLANTSWSTLRTQSANNSSTNWRLIDSNGDGRFLLQNLSTGRYLDGDTFGVDTNSSNSGNDKLWEFVEINPGQYHLVNVHYNKIMDANGISAGIDWDTGSPEADDLWTVSIV